MGVGLAEIIRFGKPELLLQDHSGGGIQDEAPGLRRVIEVKHAVERASLRIRGIPADAAQVPVVFDESQGGRLIGNAVVDVVLPRIR